MHCSWDLLWAGWIAKFGLAMSDVKMHTVIMDHCCSFIYFLSERRVRPTIMAAATANPGT